MKYVEFKKLSIANFLSIGREVVSITFENGINIITGTNKDMSDRRNAVGKTAIADALYFAIFGRTIRDISKELIINNVTNDTCSVELVFNVTAAGKTDSYRVVRQLNPGKCFLTENGVDVTRDSIANTTLFITDLISASPSIFQNCVIMTLNDTIPFMAQSKVDKRKFIESIFDLQVFGKMLSHVREEYSESKKLYEMELFKYNELSSTIQKLEEQRARIVVERAAKIEQLQRQQQQNEEKRRDLEGKLEKLVLVDVAAIKKTIKDLDEGHKKCNDSIDALTKDITVSEVRIRNLSDQISNIGTDKEVCPTCLKRISEHDHEHIEEVKLSLAKEADDEKQNLKTWISERADQRDLRLKIGGFIEKYNAKITKNALIKKDREGVIASLAMLDNWSKTVNDNIVEVAEYSTDFDTIISANNLRVSTLQNAVKSSLTTVNMLDTMKVILSEEGVKAYITKKILHILNNKIQLYLKKIGFNCTCRFNEYFEEEILNDKGRICSYFNFSGAERKSIDLACLFAFIDVRRVQGNVSYNVIFYDELFDSSLDDKGVEAACRIIVERTKDHNECAYIITHRKSGSFFENAKIITLEKQNGITRRVES